MLSKQATRLLKPKTKKNKEEESDFYQLFEKFTGAQLFDLAEEFSLLPELDTIKENVSTIVKPRKKVPKAPSKKRKPKARTVDGKIPVPSCLVRDVNNQKHPRLRFSGIFDTSLNMVKKHVKVPDAPRKTIKRRL